MIPQRTPTKWFSAIWPNLASSISENTLSVVTDLLGQLLVSEGYDFTTASAEQRVYNFVEALENPLVTQTRVRLGSAYAGGGDVEPEEYF